MAIGDYFKIGAGSNFPTAVSNDSTESAVNSKMNLKKHLMEALTGNAESSININMGQIEGKIDTTSIKGFVPLDSEIGKKISDAAARPGNMPSIADDYVPVKEQLPWDPFPRTIGYRLKTDEDRIGTKNY